MRNRNHSANSCHAVYADTALGLRLCSEILVLGINHPAENVMTLADLVNRYCGTFPVPRQSLHVAFLLLSPLH